MGDRRFKLLLPVIDGFANDLGDERFFGGMETTTFFTRSGCRAG
jgi:hypothetical protein